MRSKSSTLRMLALVGTLSAGPLAAFGLVFHAIDSDPETASLFSDAKWIGINRPFSWPNRTKVHPAPILRKTFVAGNAKAPVRLAVSAAGYYDVTLNGRPVTASMLNPTPSNYDVRSHYSVYDVSSLLVPGTNVVEAVLGRAYYDYPIDDLFMHSTITWRDSVSLLLQLSDAGGTVLAATDATWDAYPDGPVRFDCLRSGCTYDARKESLDERLWMKAAVKHGPGGRLVRESHPPVVVYARLPMREVSSGLWDSGQCMGGIAEISVRGERGAEITLVYREALDENGKLLDPEHYAEHFQTDRYTLRGEGVEKWRPQFTYHGFRYVAATVKGRAEIVAMDALAIGSDMKEVGSIETSDAALAAIQRCVRWTLRSNMVGIPTDCPSREKQGWTGDTLASVETGLFNFDSESVYLDWLRGIVDVQRPNGQIPAKSPVSANGYNLGFGPAWDDALILIPMELWRRTGSVQPLREFFPAMRRYADFAESMLTDGLAVGFGLGDWYSPDSSDRVAENVTLPSTAYLYRGIDAISSAARLLGEADEARYYAERADKVKDAFRRKYCGADGAVGRGRMTELALAVAFGLAPMPESSVRRLVATAREKGHKSDYGVQGSIWVLRVLAEHGYLLDAYRLVAHSGYPGFMDCIGNGATTLWEQWCGGRFSRNHIMFGYVSAWMYRYLGGFDFDEDNPGEIVLKPGFLEEVGRFSAVYRGIQSAWSVVSPKVFSYKVTIPAGMKAKLLLPGMGEPKALGEGVHLHTVTVD